MVRVSVVCGLCSACLCVCVSVVCVCGVCVCVVCGVCVCMHVQNQYSQCPSQDTNICHGNKTAVNHMLQLTKRLTENTTQTNAIMQYFINHKHFLNK